MAITTGILLFDDAEELDFIGPLEVFGMAKQDGDRVVTIAEGAEPVRANLGLRVVPEHTIADAPPLDVVVVPGGLGTRREAGNSVLLDWIKQVAAVKDQRGMHQTSDLRKVDILELAPFGCDDERFCVSDGFYGGGNEGRVRAKLEFAHL